MDDFIEKLNDNELRVIDNMVRDLLVLPTERLAMLACWFISKTIDLELTNRGKVKPEKKK